MIWTVAKKELRGYFNSAIAVIFLAAFLAVTLYTFFWREKFFARGLADVRPLFEWMPKLLVILVSALAMRLWADERRAGTLELLLTLPVPRWKLVVGKFVAGLLLVAIALALTLGLPLTIAAMGNLDWGPVIGGYLAALLLSAAYLAIGMCVSAATDNQIVAFVATALACSVAYAIGDSSNAVARSLGTGVRFESIARGVLDLRDLAYYGGIVAIGVAVNVVLLQRLGWGVGANARRRRAGALLAVALVAANAIALDVWLAPIQRARIDLTQEHSFSLSRSTAKILAGLDERVLIRGYFSERTHPKLAPLVPQIRDLLDEYRVAGHGKVRVEVVDPTDSDDAKREAKERFGIEPVPIELSTANEKGVINAYFTIAIEYGDQHAVLRANDLIAVRAIDADNTEVKLKNLEYQMTRTIKKTVAEFSSVEALFASTPGKIQLTAYITPSTLPENWKDGPAKLKKVVDELIKQSGGKLAFTTIQPASDGERRDLARKYGIQRYQDIDSGQTFYFHLLLQVGDRIVRIAPPQSLGEAELKTALNEGLKHAAPGFRRVVGLVSPAASPAMPMMQGMPPQQPPPPQTFRALRAELAGSYDVREVTLGAPVPGDIEALVVAGPADLDARAAEQVDQFVMRGGALVVLAGRYRLAPADGLAIEKVKTGLEAVFEKWGITLGDDVVMDVKSDTFPIPENRDLGGGVVVRELRQLAYPFFVKLDGDQLSSTSVITSGLPGAVMHWASPVKAAAQVGDDAHHVDVLLRSSADAWLTTTTQVEPDTRKYPELGFAVPTDLAADKKGAQVLAVSITGGFATGTPKPAPRQGSGAPPAARLIEHSPPDSRVVVFGASAFASDDILNLAQQLDSELAKTNVKLVHNAVDWSLADSDLLEIRGHDDAARAITTPPDGREKWRTVNIAIAALGLIVVVGFAWLRRRAVVPVIASARADQEAT